jgi:hypothetical protein
MSPISRGRRHISSVQIDCGVPLGIAGGPADMLSVLEITNGSWLQGAGPLLGFLTPDNSGFLNIKARVVTVKTMASHRVPKTDACFRLVEVESLPFRGPSESRTKAARE